MSTYLKGPAIGYINSTPGNKETNQDTNSNGVNGTSVDSRRALPGSQVYGEMEGQGPGGCHQVTDHNAAKMGPTEARSRQGWTKDENKEIWKCYIMIDQAMRGYKKKMHNIWHERNNAPQKEQRLMDQIRGSL